MKTSNFIRFASLLCALLISLSATCLYGCASDGEGDDGHDHDASGIQQGTQDNQGNQDDDNENQNSSGNITFSYANPSGKSNWGYGQTAELLVIASNNGDGIPYTGDAGSLITEVALTITHEGETYRIIGTNVTESTGGTEEGVWGNQAPVTRSFHFEIPDNIPAGSYDLEIQMAGRTGKFADVLKIAVAAEVETDDHGHVH